MGKERAKGLSWQSLLFLALVIFLLLGTIWPSLSRAQTAGKRTSALSNCKALAGALSEFKTEFGHYPGPKTRALLVTKGHTNLRPGTDANAYLAQLIVTEIIDSESYFHCEAGEGYHKADDKIDTPTDLLAPGENSYAYIMAKGEQALSEVKAITPLVITPIHSNAKIPTFDPTPYQGYYVYGAADGSGKQGKIGKQAQALSKGRTHLFQTGEDSLFGSQIPDVKIPTRQY